MFVTLDAEEQKAIELVTSSRRKMAANEALAREGCRPDRVCLILKGAAYRFRCLANGRRQIFGYLIPGDLCDTHFVVLNESDHNVSVLCDSEVATISLTALMTLLVTYPRIERALLMMSLVDAAMLREWMLNIGQRDAAQKLAHLFCELNARIHSIGHQDAAQCFAIPLTQIEIADTTGLTVVHVNRILQRFRREGLLKWTRRHFEILDHQRLADMSDFDPSYLRLNSPRAEPRVSAYG